MKDNNQLKNKYYSKQKRYKSKDLKSGGTTNPKTIFFATFFKVGVI